MMVRLVIQDRHRPVNLLDKDQSDHLVGKSHLAQRDLFRCRLIHGLTKTVRTAHHKYQAFRDRMHFLFQISRKLHGGELLPFLVQQHQIIAGLQSLSNQFALFLLLLRL